MPRRRPRSTSQPGRREGDALAADAAADVTRLRPRCDRWRRRRLMEAEFIISAVRPEQFPRERLPGDRVSGQKQRREIQPAERPGAGRRAGVHQLHAGPHANDQLLTGLARRLSISWIFPAMDTRGFPGNRLGVEAADRAYLLKRQRSGLSCLLLDARRGWMEQDLELKHGSSSTSGRTWWSPPRSTS